MKAWHVYNQVPPVPLDEDEVLHARRLVAQRCLYGVDKNLMAVDLAKLSLWLATLAKDHPFTFLDHSLRCGDSLVGLSREQIENFSWELPVVRSQKDKKTTKSSPKTDNRQPITFFGDPLTESMWRVTKTYNRFHDPDERSPDIQKLRELHAAMDQTVLEAYGWHNLVELAVDGSPLAGKKGPRCEFLLDYEDEEDDEPTTSNRQPRTRKKPWRYRWPDDFRDEVLARLLDLNQKRAEEERLAGEWGIGSGE